MDALVRSCKRHRGMADEENAECPLCLLTGFSLIPLRRHLGRHLEELSLFALPSHVMGDHEESDDEGDDGNSDSLPSINDYVVSLVVSLSDISHDEDTTTQDCSSPPVRDTSPTASSITNVNG
jgi:hypothetical protein